jgi:hypothetical protein
MGYIWVCIVLDFGTVSALKFNFSAEKSITTGLAGTSAEKRTIKGNETGVS